MIEARTKWSVDVFSSGRTNSVRRSGPEKFVVDSPEDDAREIVEKIFQRIVKGKLTKNA